MKKFNWGNYTRGERVELRYRNEQRRWVRRHAQVGCIEAVPHPRGKAPINYLVRIEMSNELVVVGRGNLRAYVPSKQLSLF